MVGGCGEAKKGGWRSSRSLPGLSGRKKTDARNLNLPGVRLILASSCRPSHRLLLLIIAAAPVVRVEVAALSFNRSKVAPEAPWEIQPPC